MGRPLQRDAWILGMSKDSSFYDEEVRPRELRQLAQSHCLAREASHALSLSRTRLNPHTFYSQTWSLA